VVPSQGAAFDFPRVNDGFSGGKILHDQHVLNVLDHAADGGIILMLDHVIGAA